MRNKFEWSMVSLGVFLIVIAGLGIFATVRDVGLCPTLQPASKVEAGKIVRVDYKQGNWSVPSRTFIHTDKRVCVYGGIITDVVLGATAYIITDECGRKFIGWDGSRFRYRLG